MRLLFAIKAMNNPGGGAERVLAIVATGLAKRGHDVQVLTFERQGGTSFYPLDSRVSRIDVGVGRTDRATNITELLNRVAALRRAVRNIKPDVAIGFMHSMFIPLGLALVGTRIPLLGSEHIVPAHYKSRPFEYALLNMAPMLMHRITVVSEQVKAAYRHQLRQSMVVVPNPNGVNVLARANVLGTVGQQKILLCVGRLSAQKDHATLINAFGRIADRVPDWKLRIVGEGDLRQKLECQIRQLGLESRITMAGAVQEINQEYAAAQLFVIPSLYESQGLVTVEALAHGLPVIGFADCEGTNELISDGVNGLLARGADRAAALAEALTTLMRDDALRHGLANAVSNILDQESTNTILDRWEILATEAIASRHH